MDECAENTHTCNRSTEICQNSHGGYQCLEKPIRSRDCPAGFKWNENTANCEGIIQFSVRFDIFFFFFD